MQKKSSLTLMSALNEAMKKDMLSLNPELSTNQIKGYLKEGVSGNYSLIDDDASIKIFFDKKNNEEFFKGKKSSLDGKFNLI
ncbi:MAG: hypothetical protein MJ252_13030 [archaeon]|nr:hypothetical protein [archaeon]